MSDPKPLTRNELARLFNNDSRAIKAFEQLFDLIPSSLTTDSTLIEENTVNVGTTISKSNEALSEANHLKDHVDSHRVLLWLSNE